MSMRESNPAPSGRRRRWISIGAAAVVLVAAGAAATGFLIHRYAGQPRRGDLVANLYVTDANGRNPEPTLLDHLRQVLLSRLTAVGADRPHVTVHRYTATGDRRRHR